MSGRRPALVATPAEGAAGAPAGAARPGAVRRAVALVTQALALASIACVAFMLVATVADVVKRTVEGSSLRGVTELGEVMMVAIVFLGLGFAEHRRAHVTMTLVVRRLRPRVAALVNACGLALVVAFVAWMVVVTSERAYQAVLVQEFRFGLVQIPVWPARVALAVGLAAYLLELTLRLVDTAAVALGRREPDDPDALEPLL